MTDYEAYLLAWEQMEKARLKLGLSPCAHATIRGIEGGYAWTISEGGQACGGYVLEVDEHPRSR